jgi:hypothetical protein
LAAEFRNATEALAVALKAAAPDIVIVGEQLSVLARFGLSGAVQAPSVSASLLLQDAIATLAAAKQTMNDVDAALAVSDRDRRAAVDRILKVARFLLGPTTLITPTITNTPDLLQTRLVGVDQTKLEDWLQKAARVRPAITTMQDLRLFTSFTGGQSLTVNVAQIPHQENEAWLGGELRKSNNADNSNALRSLARPSGPRMHLVWLTDNSTPPSGTCGLVVDEWLEVIPAASQTTGVSLYYDAPNARAPQSILLGVHPNPSASDCPWSWTMIESMLLDTLSLARLRTVELEQLAPTAVDEYLPAIYARDGMTNVQPLHRLSLNFLTTVGMSAVARRATIDLREGHG